MNKATTKDGLPTNARRYNVQVIKAIASKRNLNQDFVRQCVRGHRNSETAFQIRKEYNDLAFQLANLLGG